jgi:hypothetical protein
MALDGYVDEISREVVSGWAIDTDRLDQPVDVRISVNGQVAASFPTNRSRPDVGARMKARLASDGAFTGSYGFEFYFHPPLSVFREQTVEVRFAATDALLGDGSKKLSIPKSRHLQFSPLLVTGPGRSGSTLLMQRLLRHPEIVVADRYPFEIKLISYYARAYQVLASGADRDRSSNPGSIATDPYFVGYNPFNRPGYFAIAKDRAMLGDFFERRVPQTLVDTLAQLLTGYYGILAIDQCKVGARFFAEKAESDDVVRHGTRLFSLGAREILLIRDPRDIICSANAFWKSGGERRLAQLADELRRLQAIHDENRADTTLVRYEDLVTKPAETMAAIQRFLGLREQYEGEQVASDAALFARHGTSVTPADSIGRWKSDMDGNDIAVCEREFAPFLGRFGYA